ncbi:MAG: hypothetical protein KGI26_04330 [Thaumarchaeota archaeon]|nr:hypothetical protein [Nitrososphaerota archaeon]
MEEGIVETPVGGAVVETEGQSRRVVSGVRPDDCLIGPLEAHARSLSRSMWIGRDCRASSDESPAFHDFGTGYEDGDGRDIGRQCTDEDSIHREGGMHPFGEGLIGRDFDSYPCSRSSKGTWGAWLGWDGKKPKGRLLRGSVNCRENDHNDEDYNDCYYDKCPDPSQFTPATAIAQEPKFFPTTVNYPEPAPRKLKCKPQNGPQERKV